MPESRTWNEAADWGIVQATPLCLNHKDVQVWRIDLDRSNNYLRYFDSILSPEERERAFRFQHRLDTERFIASHGSLRLIVSSYIGLTPSSFHFEVTDNGKPYLAGNEINFNLTHSGSMALVAVTRGRRIGIDVERINSDVEYDQIALNFFSEVENECLWALPADLKCEAFYRCWVLKEAYVKARGDGLSLSLSEFDVQFLPGQGPRLCQVRGEPGEEGRWLLCLQDFGDGYLAAVALESVSVPRQT